MFKIALQCITWLNTRYKFLFPRISGGTRDRKNHLDKDKYNIPHFYRDKYKSILYILIKNKINYCENCFLYFLNEKSPETI